MNSNCLRKVFFFGVITKCIEKVSESGAYKEPCKLSMMEFFLAKIVDE